MTFPSVATGATLLDNALDSPEAVSGFLMEGPGATSFPLGRMRLESTLGEEAGRRANLVFWLPQDFSDRVRVEFDFWPIREPGLAILFFSTRGRRGEDLFDPSLSPRTGDYDEYHSGDLDAYHVSYFRRKAVKERAFQTCNLRKSHGFHLVAQGADPLPSVADAIPPYRVRLEQFGPHVRFGINQLVLFDWLDDGGVGGPAHLGGGKIGFRQMAPLIGEYANLRIEELVPGE